MPRIVKIDDRADPRIAAYRDIRERDLVGRDGLFVAEGDVVVRVLLGASLYRPLSLFLAEKRVAALENEIARLPDSVSVFVAPQSIMDTIVGFPMHRGILALGRRAESENTAFQGSSATAQGEGSRGQSSRGQGGRG